MSDDGWRKRNERLAEQSNEALQRGDEMRSRLLWEAYLRKEIMRLAEKEARMRAGEEGGDAHTEA